MVTTDIVRLSAPEQPISELSLSTSIIISCLRRGITFLLRRIWHAFILKIWHTFILKAQMWSGGEREEGAVRLRMPLTERAQTQREWDGISSLSPPIRRALHHASDGFCNGMFLSTEPSRAAAVSSSMLSGVAASCWHVSQVLRVCVTRGWQ